MRWFMNELGWGVIASEHGDLFVHCSQIDMKGYRTLKEGQQVEYRVRPGGRQSKFGAVASCRPLD